MCQVDGVIEEISDEGRTRRSHLFWVVRSAGHKSVWESSYSFVIVRWLLCGYRRRWRMEEEHERSRERGEGTYRVGFDP